MKSPHQLSSRLVRNSPERANHRGSSRLGKRIREPQELEPRPPRSNRGLTGRQYHQSSSLLPQAQSVDLPLCELVVSREFQIALGQQVATKHAVGREVKDRTIASDILHPRLLRLIAQVDLLLCVLLRD